MADVKALAIVGAYAGLMWLSVLLGTSIANWIFGPYSMLMSDSIQDFYVLVQLTPLAILIAIPLFMCAWILDIVSEGRSSVFDA